MNNTYLLDERERIIEVTGPWDEFAARNDGDGARVDDVCGRSLWDFVSGDATRMWLDVLFQFARLRSEVVTRPYRCDSPDARRFMNMKVIPEESGFLRVEHELLQVEPLALRVEITHAPTALQLYARCSFCCRIRSDGRWGEATDGWESIEEGLSLQVVYTVCEDCKQSIQQSNALVRMGSNDAG